MPATNTLIEREVIDCAPVVIREPFSAFESPLSIVAPTFVLPSRPLTGAGVGVGFAVDVRVGVAVGVFVGPVVGVAVGVCVGPAVGVCVGVSVGAAVGVCVGVAVEAAPPPPCSDRRTTAARDGTPDELITNSM